MTDPAEYAAQFQHDVFLAEATRDRSVQTHQRILGVSDLGHCRSYAARFLNNDPFTDATSQKQSMRGTWMHAGVLPAVAAQRDGALVEQEVTVKLSNGFEVVGHVDLIEPAEPSVTDLKSVDGSLPSVRRYGATPQQKMQRHLYGAGALQNGLLDQPYGPEGLIVRNIWMDLADLDATPHVEQEPYDLSYLDTAATFVDEVAYYLDTNQVDDAPRDKDYHWCRTFCPFFTACRGPESAPPEVIESDEYVVAAALHREALDLEGEAKQLKKAAAEVLDRIEPDSKVTLQGSDGRRFKYASTWVGPSEISYTRQGYYRREVKEL